MIPNHLIDKAAQAIVTGTGGDSLLADMHPEDAAYARADARAALEAVAAELVEYAWDDGYAIGWNEGRNGEFDPQNPYRASETA